jgi:hypothetical protein
MPQLDIFLWFSQIFWLLIFFICFISFVFILYIPVSYCIESFPFFKKIDHFNYSNFLVLSYSGNIQDFFYLYIDIR